MELGYLGDYIIILFKLRLLDSEEPRTLLSTLLGEFANMAFISVIVVSLITGDLANEVELAVVV